MEEKYQCGWCDTKEKCLMKDQCGSGGDTGSWLHRNQSCPNGHKATISRVSPHQLQVTTARTLQIDIDNFPNLTGRYLCVFSAFHAVLKVNATRTQSGVYCTTPRTDLLPVIPRGESSYISKLSVMIESGKEIVATNFTFYDCNSYSSCTNCVSSLFPCDWCVDAHRCTHDTSENCRNDILVTGVNRIGPSIRSGPTFCPRITTVGSQPSQILVHSGLNKAIRVHVQHIAQFIIQNRFVCQFNIEGRVTSVNAQLLGDKIYCDEMEFTYTSHTPNITATLAVIWGQSKVLDNPDNIHIVIYRCNDMADTCGMCLHMEEKYQCGWCDTKEKCLMKDQCGSGGDTGSWLHRNQSCPNGPHTAFGS